MPDPCEYRWQASRADAETLDVNHVCNEERGHAGDHMCVCGRRTSQVDLSTVEWKGRMVPFHLLIEHATDEEAALEIAHAVLDGFPPMNDADVVIRAYGSFWIADVTVWWA